MSRSVWVWFAPLALAAVTAAGCGDEASPEAPDLAGDPGNVAPAAGAGGGASAPVGPGAGGAQQPSGSETPNAGLDGAPVDGNNAGAGAGAAGAAPAAGGATGAGGAAAESGSPFPASVTRPRILIIGDSISAGPGCYKKYLLADLNANGFTSFDFVGEYTDDCGGGVMHGARSCTTAQDYVQPEFTLRADCGGGTYPGLAALAAEYTPDLIMLQLGVNDVWNGLAIETILASYGTLVEQARAQNPNVVIAVAQIQQIRPMDAGGEATFARAQQLIEAVPAWAAALSRPESRVVVADLWTNSDVAQTNDGVHPTEEGAQRMGQNWYTALSTILPRD